MLKKLRDLIEFGLFIISCLILNLTWFIFFFSIWNGNDGIGALLFWVGVIIFMIAITPIVIKLIDRWDSL